MSNATYFEALERQMRSLMTNLSSRFDEESRAGVEHYLDVGEYEMAFEGMFLSLLKLDPVPDIPNIEEWRAHAVRLGLDKESVFDAGFWNKFSEVFGL